MAGKYDLETDKLLGILKATVIRPTSSHAATNEEIAAFVVVANQYGLNPFTREIHAFVGKGGQVVPIVGIDGWVSLVNRKDNFNGLDFEEHTTEEGVLIAVTCTMHVKGREHPIRVTEYLSECHRNTEPWKAMPRRMLRHKAYIQAARYCFGFSGIYDEDEAADIIKNAQAEQPTEPPRKRTNLRKAETVPIVEVEANNETFDEEPIPELAAEKLDPDMEETIDNIRAAIKCPNPQFSMILSTLRSIKDKIGERLFRELKEECDRARVAAGK